MTRLCKIILLDFLAFLGILNHGGCINEASFRRIKGKYLSNHVFRTLETRNEFDCSAYCSREGVCVSVNFKISDQGTGLCELNSARLQDPNDGENDEKFDYLEIVTRTCDDKTQYFSKQTRRCTSYATSCNELLDNDRVLPNGVYTLKTKDSLEQYSVYCQMTEIPQCGPGGWTLVAKVNGDKNQTNYNSPYWTIKETHAVEDGLEGLSEKQTKLASYWNTPFTKICLGMKVNGVTNWIAIDHTASSLYDVIASGNFQATSVGRNTWKSLIAGSSLQRNCNKEGFNMARTHQHNVYIYVRIGIIGNNEDDCTTCDSYIGFGASFSGCGVVSGITCGNLAVCPQVSVYNDDTYISAFGYILVQ